MCPSHVVGDFEELGTKKVQPRVRVVLPVQDFTLDWRRCNLIANYMAEYASYFFEQKDRAENLISSVFYELIEHLALCARETSSIEVAFSTAEGWLVFEIGLSMPSEQASCFKELLERIHASDLDSFYMELLEAGADSDKPEKRMGMVMIAHDYRAHLSALLHGEGKLSTVRALVRQEEITL